MSRGVPDPGGIPIEGPMGGHILGGGLIMPGEGAPRPIGGEEHLMAGWVLSRPGNTVAAAAVRSSSTSSLWSNPVGMAHQPRGLAQQVHGNTSQDSTTCSPADFWAPSSISKWHSGNARIFGRRSFCPRDQVLLSQWRQDWEIFSLSFLLVWSSLA